MKHMSRAFSCFVRIHWFTALIETHSVKPAKCPTREAQTLERTKDGTVPYSSLMSEVGGPSTIGRLSTVRIFDTFCTQAPSFKYDFEAWLFAALKNIFASHNRITQERADGNYIWHASLVLLYYLQVSWILISLILQM